MSGENSTVSLKIHKAHDQIRQANYFRLSWRAPLTLIICAEILT
jgi:hypothetical protein